MLRKDLIWLQVTRKKYARQYQDNTKKYGKMQSAMKCFFFVFAPKKSSVSVDTYEIMSNV